MAHKRKTVTDLERKRQGKYRPRENDYNFT